MKLSFVLALSISSIPAFAEEGSAPEYPRRVFWGDTHVHTDLSGDAFSMGGTRLTSEDAYRFAKGERVRATGGMEVQLRRPLDFLLVADHAENLGVLPRLVAGDDSIPDTETSRHWKQVLTGLPALRDLLNAETLEEFKEGGQAFVTAKAAHGADYGLSEKFQRSVWEGVIAIAEKHNDPGTFTAFIGYEWSGRYESAMIHRNVLFADGSDLTSKVIPFSNFDSHDPEDLWAYLDDYEERTGGNVISIPHNSNLSRGGMFALSTFLDKPMTEAYARNRARWEPMIEVTQIKGDSEAHPLLSPDDAFADFETWPPKNWSLVTAQYTDKAKADGKKSKTDIGGKAAAKQVKPKVSGKGIESKKPPTDPIQEKQSSYARSALKMGLVIEANLGANPFKFGMIGSTDSHTALATADEDLFWGKFGANEPNRYRSTDSWYYSASGYAAVWATENTRASLFAALERKETYATTGPRMSVRFFGGWDFETKDVDESKLAQVGYEKGVPMGDDLASAPDGKAPRFLIWAMKDPEGANLDRVQVVKGWRDDGGELHEKIYNVALSDDRKVDQHGKAEPVGNTVDVADASYRNSIGDVELSTVWQDPDFESNFHAFYYVRVLEIPTPRWTTFDAKRFALGTLPDGIPTAVQERAYTSPIWYTPEP